MAYSLLSDAVAELNAIDTSTSLADIYLACKAASDAGATSVPVTLITDIYTRVMNPTGYISPYDLAFGLKILYFLDAWAVKAGAYGFAGTVYGVRSGVTYSPALTAANISQPENQAVVTTTGATTFGNASFQTAYSVTIPSWIKSTTLIRVRCWGGGGGGGGIGAGGLTTSSCSGGGGGGYSEGLVAYSTISSGTITVGAGGTAGTGGSSGVGGGNGGTSSFGGFSATGGTGGLYQVGTGGTVGQPGGAGSGGIFNYTGGTGGNGIDYNINAFVNYGGGGGSAAGPWGTGKTGSVYNGAGTGTGTTATTYVTNWMSPYLSANISGSIGGNYGQPGAAGGIFGGGGGAYNGSQNTNAAGGNGGIAAGGGGAAGTNNAVRAGGAGGPGLVIVEWFS